MEKGTFLCMFLSPQFSMSRGYVVCAASCNICSYESKHLCSPGKPDGSLIGFQRNLLPSVATACSFSLSWLLRKLDLLNRLTVLRQCSDGCFTDIWEHCPKVPRLMIPCFWREKSLSMDGDTAIFTQSERGVWDLENQAKHRMKQIWSDIFMVDTCYLWWLSN